MSFILLLLLLTITILVILVLRKNQAKHTRETVDRTAPLPALGDNLVPDFAVVHADQLVPELRGEPTPPEPHAVQRAPDTRIEPVAHISAKAVDSWQLQVKNCRTTHQYDAALAICRQHFPRGQAMTQAAIILRQQIKSRQENKLPFSPLLNALYDLAALADIYGTESRLRTADLTRLERVLQHCSEQYKLLGHEKLKLLNKSDARLLEQAWGKPDAHCHVKEIYAI